LTLPILVYKAVNGPSPLYLADDCQVTTSSSRQRLPSSNAAMHEAQKLTQVWVIDHPLLLEQPASPPTWFPTDSLWDPLVGEDADVLLTTVAPSDCCFINGPYLLTYFVTNTALTMRNEKKAILTTKNYWWQFTKI